MVMILTRYFCRVLIAVLETKLSHWRSRYAACFFHSDMNEYAETGVIFQQYLPRDGRTVSPETHDTTFRHPMA